MRLQDLNDSLDWEEQYWRQERCSTDPPYEDSPVARVARRVADLWQPNGQPTDLFYEAAFDIGDNGGLELNVDKLRDYLLGDQ